RGRASGNVRRSVLSVASVPVRWQLPRTAPGTDARLRTAIRDITDGARPPRGGTLVVHLSVYGGQVLSASISSARSRASYLEGKGEPCCRWVPTAELVARRSCCFSSSSSSRTSS